MPPPPPPPRHPEEGPWKRTASELERSLHFLQRQHGETLAQLHEEVERLKRENKELHYKLIMYPVLQNVSDHPSFEKTHHRDASVSKSSHGSRMGRDHREDDFVLFGKPHHRGRSGRKTSRHAKVATEEDSSSGGFSGLEDVEVRATHPKTSADVFSLEGEGARDTPDEDRDTPKEDGVTSKEVTALIPEPKETPTKKELHSPRVSILEPPHTMRPPCKETEVCDQTTSPILPPSPAQSRAEEVKIPAASSNPFLASVLPSCMRKPPTLEECEAVIRQLWNINHMQMQELMYLRSCLEDIHRTRRIPEDYMLAGHIGNSQTTRLPRMKNTPKQCRLLNPLPAAERSVLPALKQTLGNTFAERQKRAQAIQRKRLNRPAY